MLSNNPSRLGAAFSAAGSFALAGAIALTLGTDSARAESGPAYRGFESDGMGRTGTASVNGPSALFLNPAGLAGLKGEGFEASADWGLNSVLLDYAKWAADNAKYLNSFDTLLTKIGPVQNKWAPFSNAFVMQGHYQDFALAAVMDIRYDLSLSKAVVTPVPGVGMLSDIQLVTGRGFSPTPEWKVGFSAKYLYRLRFPDQLLGTTDEPFFVVKHVLQDNSKSALQKISVASDVADAGQGFGLNLGAMRQLPMGFTAGASVLDLPTFYNGGFLYPQLNLGGAYAKDFDILEGLHHRVIVNLDWQIPTAWQPWYKQWKMGAAVEGRMGERLVSLIALGLNDGYPSFGLKVGYYLNLYYLYTAEETGSYPGQRKLSFHKLGIDFEF